MGTYSDKVANPQNPTYNIQVSACLTLIKQLEALGFSQIVSRLPALTRMDRQDSVEEALQRGYISPEDMAEIIIGANGKPPTAWAAGIAKELAYDDPDSKPNPKLVGEGNFQKVYQDLTGDNEGDNWRSAMQRQVPHTRDATAYVLTKTVAGA